MAQSVLTEAHSRLLADKAAILHDANIQEEWLHRTTDGFLNEHVQDYAVRFKFHKGEGIAGLIAYGNTMGDPTDHMSSLCGLLTRNFIRCRVVTLDTFISSDDEDLLTMSCVAIPNFFVGMPLIDWKIGVLVDRLLSRKLAGKQTILWASDEQQLKQKYGTEFVLMVTRDYVKVRP